MTKSRGFLIATAVVLLAAAAVFSFTRFAPAHPLLPTKPGALCRTNLKLIEAGKQQWALENGKTVKDPPPTMADLEPYFGSLGHNSLECPCGGVYTIGRLDQAPTCSLSLEEHTYARWDAHHAKSTAVQQSATNNLPAGNQLKGSPTSPGSGR
jgi:hypothetical protein